MAPADTSFIYDVAFSFLSADEHIARQLNDLLKSRYSTFIYSDPERQRLLGGRDGEAAFGRIFGVESRTVVVLYREAWGERGFTATEANAIRDRAREQGFGFATFILMGEPPTPPSWLPRNRIWVDLQRLGVETTAAVIDSRIQEADGSPREETPASVAGRIARERRLDAERNNFLLSEAGASAAENEFKVMFAEIERVCVQSHGLLFKPERFSGVHVFSFGGERVLFTLNLPMIGTTKPELLVEGVGMGWRPRGGPPLWKKVYEFYLGPTEERGWREKHSPRRQEFFTTVGLVDAVALEVLNRISNEPRKK